MNSHDPIPANPARRIGLGQIALGLAAAWFCVHAAIYAVGMCQLDPVLFKHLEHAMKHFFGWQAGGFLVAAIIVGTRRPSAAGRVLGGYLVLSTLVLLAFSKNAAMIAELAVLLLWTVCTVQGMRLAIAWAVGERYATWGVAMAAVYAALVPICFFLGVLHAITPSNVAALAVATALPGAVLWLRRLTRPNVVPRSHAPRRNEKAIIAWCLLEVIWAILAVEFIGASTSELASDSARVHVPYMQRVIADHGLSHQYACWHRLQPMAVQTYSAAITTVGSLAAAKWFSWLALAALVLLVAEEVQRRSGSLELGLFAGAAVLSCPLLAGLSNSLYVDHVMAMLCTAGFVVLFRALRPPCLRGILLSAAIMGSMVQVKYTGLVFGVVWGLFLAVDLLRKCDWRIALRWSATAGALLVATALPWYVYVYLGTGNPFYPYLHHWFPSPYWVNDFTLQKFFEVTFKMPPGVGGAAKFPWLATYRTASFVEGYDGVLGFWALALAPCWFLGKGDILHLCHASSGPLHKKQNVPFSSYWDMAIVGVAMIVGIIAYTPYVRYWIPAYPLLVASCVLAAGSLFRSIQWRPEGRWTPVLAGTALALLLFLPAPILCLDVPWDAYAKRISGEEYLARSFQGYQATKQLNTILAPDDGVLCTGCDGVYLVGGRPYEFVFWWNGVHHIHDRASFAEFCRRYGIRYWMVNHFSLASRRVEGSRDIVAEYWNDARLVTASGTVAVYDVASPAREKLPATMRCEWPTLLEDSEKPWTPFDPSKDWVNLTTAAAATRPAKETIAVAGAAWIGHRLDPEIPGGICRVSLGLWSSQPTDPMMEITWYDAKGNLLSRVIGTSYGKSDFQTWLCSSVPPNAKNGWIYLREWKQKPIHLKRGTVTFWTPQTASAAVAKRRT